MCLGLASHDAATGPSAIRLVLGATLPASTVGGRANVARTSHNRARCDELLLGDFRVEFPLATQRERIVFDVS